MFGDRASRDVAQKLGGKAAPARYRCASIPVAVPACCPCMDIPNAGCDHASLVGLCITAARSKLQNLAPNLRGAHSWIAFIQS